MTTREIGQHRDAHLEVEKLVRKAGPVLETFVQERIKLDGPMFRQIGPDLRHILTGKTIEEELSPAELRKTKPHGFADWAPDTEEQVSHDIIENACLRPSPKNLGALYKLVGEVRYHEILKQWGTDPARMLPGERPGYAEHKAAKSGEKAPRDHSNNPFHKSQWNISKQGALVKTLGLERANQIARSVGSHVGATKANPDF
jgi:hypothetical protein